MGPDTPAGRDEARAADRAGDRRLGRAWTPATEGGFEPLLESCGGRRHPDPPRRPSAVEALEQAIANGRAVCNGDHRLGEPLVPARHARPAPRRRQRARPGDLAQGRGHDAGRLSHAPARPRAGAAGARGRSRRWPMPRSRSPAPDRRRSGPATCRASRWRRGRPAISCSTRPSSMLFAPVVTVPLMASAACRSACSSWASSTRMRA